MKAFIYLFCFVFLFLHQYVSGCTAFQLTSQDGSHIYGRSMEFGFELNSNLLIVPRGMAYKGTAPAINDQAQTGIRWKTQYGFVGMNQSFAPTFVSDGMNEKGLVASVLYFPGFAAYETPDPKRTERTLGAWELPTYLLSTCATIDEVTDQLASLLVADEPVPGLGTFVIPLHFYISDKEGKALVVEYVQGKRNIYKNPLQTLTNSPYFDWHLNNLSNYMNLSPIDIKELALPNWKISTLGQGSGLLGLPGDYTPPSRFVRAALFSQWATPPKTALETVNLAFHLLNTFDIFAGIIQSPKNTNAPLKEVAHLIKEDTTEWVIVHDLTHLKTYFRTYEDLRVKVVDLTQIDFNQSSFSQIALLRTFSAEDVSQNAKPFQPN